LWAVPTWQWLLAVLLLVGNFLSSASETALTALGDVRARQLLERGGKRARLLGIWVEHPERVLTTMLISNTLVNLGFGALATIIGGTVAVHYDPRTVAWVAAVLSPLGVLVFLFLGEVLPKTVAKRHPIRMSLLLIPFVQLVYWALWPLSIGLVKLTSSIVRLFGGGRASPVPSVTSEEIEYLIDLGSREGVLDEVKEELLNSVLEFADRVAKEIMVSRTKVVAIDKDAPPDEIVRVVTDNPHSRMPVYEDSIDNVVGILLVREIIHEIRSGSKTFSMERYLKPPYFVPEQMKISRLLKEMQKRKTHIAIVVDEFGGTSGIATLEDVIEEIVGEIQDEADTEVAQVKPVAEGVFLADAGMSLRDLEAFLTGIGSEVQFPEEGDYETLGGFVTATAGKVPPVGSLIVWNGLAFTVRAGDERKITKVEIAIKPTPTEPPGPEKPLTH
jgi:CBS domain containing-hemolysin-like protein